VSVELRCGCASARRHAPALKTAAAHLLRELRLEVAELSVVITSDRAIRALNRQYRKKDEPTDVLAFPLLSDDRPLAPRERARVRVGGLLRHTTSSLRASTSPAGREPALSLPKGRQHRRATSMPPGEGACSPLFSSLGDIVISIDTARRQALELAVPLKERLRALLIHGCLHLLGYDHERSPAAARRMFAKERALAVKLARNHRGSRPA